MFGNNYPLNFEGRKVKFWKNYSPPTFPGNSQLPPLWGNLPNSTPKVPSFKNPLNSPILNWGS